MTAFPSAEFPPSGCRWCGIARHVHAGRWSKALADTGTHGWYLYIHPTTEQIRVRLLARYETRRRTT
jgi:hypothetical protein